MDRSVIMEVLKRVYWERVSEWIDDSCGETNYEDVDQMKMKIEEYGGDDDYGQDDEERFDDGEEEEERLEIHPQDRFTLQPFAPASCSQLNVRSVKRAQSSLLKCSGPVRGLLCLVDYFGVRIFNLGTGEITPWIMSNAGKPKFLLADPQYFFGFDPISGKHKVFCRWFSWKSGTMTCQFEVLTVGEDTSFRAIDEVPPFVVGFRRNHACANGSVYWHKKTESFELTMAFDFGSEKFRTIPIPEFTRFEHTGESSSSKEAVKRRYQEVAQSYRPGFCPSYNGLIEMDGCVTLVRRRHQTVKMWKFHDHNKEENQNGSSGKEDWSELEDIRLPDEITSDVFIYYHQVPGKRQLILETYILSNFTGSRSPD